MRPGYALPRLLPLLVLVPTGLLAWLGWRAAGSFDDAEVTRIATDVDVAAQRLQGRAPALRDRLAGEIRVVLQAEAAALARDLPGRADDERAARVERVRARLRAAGLKVERVRLLDAAGASIHPAAWREEGTTPSASSTSALLLHLRERADRAWYAPGGGRDEAVAVWREARARFRSPRLRTLASLEIARLRARGDDSGAAAAAAWERLAAEHGPDLVSAYGRPALLLLLAAAAHDPARRRELAALDRSGIADRVPLTSVERARLRALLPSAAPTRAPWGGPPDARRQAARATLHADVAGGARLEVQVAYAVLARRLRALAAPGGALTTDPETRLRILGLDGPPRIDPEDAGRFAEVSVQRVVLELPGTLPAIAWVEHRAWGRALAEARDRRLGVALAIALLVAVTVLGLHLVRRGLARERAARRLRDEFIANVSHEVRTPLTSVLLHSQMLAEADVGPDARAEHARIVRAEGRRLAALVDDMLDFTSLERGTRRLEPSPVDVAAAAREALAAVRLRAEAEGTALLCEGPDAEVVALADPAALARVLANLVGNARKHGRPARDGGPSRVRVLARAASAGVFVEVRDNGPGVPPEERARVFERFGRGRDAQRVAGSGIGLALARDLARAMQGDLAVDDDGRETIFRLRLPPVPELDPEAGA